MSKPIRPLIFTFKDKQLKRDTWRESKKLGVTWSDFKALYSSAGLTGDAYWIAVHPNMKTIQINWKVIVRSVKKNSYPNSMYKFFAHLF